MAITPRNTTLRNKARARFKKTRPPCAICGAPINWTAAYPEPDSFVVDHVVPLAAGGADHPTNWQAAHQHCNRQKSDRTDGGPILRRSGSIRRPGEGTPSGA